MNANIAGICLKGSHALLAWGEALTIGRIKRVYNTMLADMALVSPVFVLSVCALVLNSAR